MKALISFCLTAALALTLNASDTIVLDEVAIKNLGLQLGDVQPRTFEAIAFAIGQLEEIPSRRGILSSRIAGRIVELNVEVGDRVEKGQVLALLESRQVGNPPPRVPLKSPISGVVVSSKIHLGEPVEPSDRLMELSDRETLWARASIPEAEMEGIRVGTKARLIIPAMGRQPIEASLKRFGIKGHAETSTIEGLFEVPNPKGRLSPGMRVEFSIVRSSRPSVLSIPRAAVQGDHLQRHVFVQNFTLANAFEKSPVVLGEKNDLLVEVISGLFPGDRVVTEGSYALSFSGSGTGMSLKEALDAAHGHEHNEDGSEMTAEQKEKKNQDQHPAESHAQTESQPPWLLAYAGFMTLLCLWLLQGSLRRRKKD